MYDSNISKVALAKELGVSRSSLYYRPKQPVADEILKQKIIAVMAEHPAYGHRRIAFALHINKKAVIRIMKKNNLKPTIRRRWYPVKLCDLGQPESRIENVLKHICPLRPNVVWAGDFTYLRFQDAFWYLSTVIDVYTREIIGWHVANRHTANLIANVFTDAVRRTQTAPTYFHSDQGSEYLSGTYALLLSAHGTIPSHSQKSSPWQNGYQESFYSQFKLELGDLNRFNHAGEFIEAIHRQIAYYNTRRIHTALKMPPVIYKKTQIQKYAAYAAS